MATNNTNFIVKDLDTPLYRDWIFWLWIVATVLPMINTIDNASTQDPITGATTFDVASGLIDAGFLLVIQWLVFNLLPRSIRLNYRKGRN